MSVSESWYLIQWYEGSVMVASIVGPAAVLFDDNPIRIPRAAAYFGIYIVLAIVARGKATFAILKYPATDISREGFALLLLNCCQQVFGFLQGVLRNLMQSIKRWRGIVKSRPCGLNERDGDRMWGRFRRRAGVEGICGTAEQESTKDDEYSINLPHSIHRFGFVSRGEAVQYEP